MLSYEGSKKRARESKSHRGTAAFIIDCRLRCWDRLYIQTKTKTKTKTKTNSLVSYEEIPGKKRGEKVNQRE